MILLGAVLAYLLGSIPSAVWYGKIFHKIDIRTFGSGNAGATNTLRTLGKKAGIVVLLFDVLKGFLAVNLVYLLPASPQGSFDIETIKLIYGLLAVIGHIFPVFAGFRGGKGVATSLGVILGIMPVAALGAIIVFLVVLFCSRYVSLASMFGAVSFPIVAYFFAPQAYAYKYMVAGFILTLIILIKHKKNISLLLAGKENKIGGKSAN